jgi:hypothetical protein
MLAAPEPRQEQPKQEQPRAAAADVSALSSMLASKWKGGGGGGGEAGGELASKRDSLKPGQIRSFRIAKLDPGKKRIDLELAG